MAIAVAGVRLVRVVSQQGAVVRLPHHPGLRRRVLALQVPRRDGEDLVERRVAIAATTTTGRRRPCHSL